MMRILFGLVVGLCLSGSVNAATIVQEIALNEIHARDGTTTGNNPVDMLLSPFDHELGTLISLEFSYQRELRGSRSIGDDLRGWLIYYRSDQGYLSNKSESFLLSGDVRYWGFWGLIKNGEASGVVSDSYVMSETLLPSWFDNGLAAIDGSQETHIGIYPLAGMEAGGTSESFHFTIMYRVKAIYHYTPAIGAVPEPANWAMMIMGFGLIGFAARRRSAAIAA